MIFGILFTVACIAITVRIIRSLTVLKEFGTPFAVSLSLIVTLFLYLIPVVALVAMPLFPIWFFLPLPFVMLFFAPHILLSRSIIRRLENAGTSRVEKIERAIRDSVWLGFGGLAYLSIIWGIYIAAAYYAADVPSLP